MNKTQSPHVSQLDSATRTKVVKLHISLTFVYKVLAVGLSYLLVPLTINYLDIEQYGIWMTLLSVMSWVVFFDIGLGNGLRNKLTEAFSVNDIKLAKTYVSTAYIAISFISLIFFVILLVILPFTNWTKVFNTTSVNNAELLKLVFVVGFLFLFNFVMSLCNQMFYDYQKSSLIAIKQVLLNLIALILIYILIHYTSGRLLYLGACYGMSMILSNIVLVFYFLKKHKEVIPALKWVDLSRIREIATLGIKFFIIQIAALVIFATDNMIITQVLGPAEVTPYNIVFKLFSVITIGHGIVIAPLWSAYTEAYAKGDIKWIRNALRKLNMLMIPIMVCVLILIVFARGIINIWIGSHVDFHESLVVFMGLYILVSVWNRIYSIFLNGIGHLKLPMITSFFAALINIPLSIYFATTLQLGSSGVILGTIVCLSPGIFLGPLQTWYIICVKNKRDVLDAIFS